MKRKLINTEGADSKEDLQLDCGHPLPPEAAAAESVDCPACDRLEMPADFVAYKRTPEFNETTLPKGLRNDHSTKSGVWGVIHVVSGELRYVIDSWNQEWLLSPDQNGIVAPEVLHYVAPVGPVRFYVEFFRKPT